LRIYLAGPDCFRADAFEHFGRLKEQAAAFGFEAFSPLDSEVDINAADIVPTIFRINMEDIDKCDIVVANIAPFRGCLVDDGTAFELGAAFAKGKRIVCYTPTAKVPMKQRVEKDFAEHGEYLQSKAYPRTEDFPGCKDPGPVNLMIVEAVKASKDGAILESYEQCLQFLAKGAAAAATPTEEPSAKRARCEA